MNFVYGFFFLVIFTLNPSFASEFHTIQEPGYDHLKVKPGWFWNPPADCGLTAAGLAQHSVIYPDNTREKAHENSLHSFLRQKMTIHSGGQAFSITERGAVWLGGDQKEQYDTTDISLYRESLAILDHQIINKMDIVLTGPESCRENVEHKKHPVTIQQTPDWVHQLPSSPGFNYAVGISEGYFYPATSWQTAESTARRNLSASINSRVRGLHDQEIGVSTEVLYSDLAVTLHNSAIISRYHDPVSNLYYVLIRMPVR